MPIYNKANKKYGSVFRGCSFNDLGGFHTFLPMRKRTLVLIRN